APTSQDITSLESASIAQKVQISPCPSTRAFRALAPTKDHCSSASTRVADRFRRRWYWNPSANSPASSRRRRIVVTADPVRREVARTDIPSVRQRRIMARRVSGVLFMEGVYLALGIDASPICVYL